MDWQTPAQLRPAERKSRPPTEATSAQRRQSRNLFPKGIHVAFVHRNLVEHSLTSNLSQSKYTNSFKLSTVRHQYLSASAGFWPRCVVRRFKSSNPSAASSS